MKILEKITLIIYSNLMLILSVILLSITGTSSNVASYISSGICGLTITFFGGGGIDGNDGLFTFSIIGLAIGV